LYYFDDATDTWILLTNDLEWVLEIGVNTSDIELYGEQYAGYVYAYVKHLSLFGLGGSLYGQETTPSTTPTETDLSWLWDLIQTYWMYIAGAVLAILVIFALKRRRK
jgi:LPXTG-motif cell wall-anchored protein